MDAEGRAATRVAILQFGDVASKEKFIVADFTTPMVAVGHTHIMHSG